MISKVKVNHRTPLRRLSKNINYLIKMIVLTVLPMVKLPASNCKTKVRTMLATLSILQEASNATQSWSIDPREECRESTSANPVPSKA